MSNKYTEIISRVIDQYVDKDRVRPSWVANEASLVIDPDGVSPIEMKLAALQTFRQVAASLLRGKFQPENERDALQHELWPDLQQMYPTAKTASDEEPEYVRPEFLTLDDVLWNIGRLRKEASTKVKHANALESWALERGLIAA